MKTIQKYFPDLTDIQIDQLSKLKALYVDWNSKINVISRKDIDNLYLHHVLHSMAIAKFTKFIPGADILDLGTGGGFPGIPLAILFPETNFYLADGTKKKIRVVNEVIEALDLKNVRGHHQRAEELKIKFDFVVCRAVTTIDKLVIWSKMLIKEDQEHGTPNGLIALKGGNIKQELKLLPKKEYTEIVKLSTYFKEEYFEGKYVVYVQI